MRYIEPGIIVKNRLSEEQIPKWEAAVLSFRDYKGSKELVRVFNAKPVGYKVLFGMQESEECPFVYEAVIGDKAVGIVTRCIWGGPQVAILMEELAYMGIKYAVGYGAAGGIDPAFCRGQQVIASSALPTDGTSRMYPDGKLLADEELVIRTQKAAEKLSWDIQCVVAATVDALYRETDTLVAGWRNQGAHIVNMETSPFYAASSACGVRSVWIGHISDCLGAKWEDWYANRDEMTSMTANICFRLLKDVLGTG